MPPFYVENIYIESNSRQWHCKTLFSDYLQKKRFLMEYIFIYLQRNIEYIENQPNGLKLIHFHIYQS